MTSAHVRQPQHQPQTRPQPQPLPFSVVAKPTGAACNLDCSYCFFLSKELLYDEKRQRMDKHTLENYIRQYLAASPDGPVVMLWQGGEPTMRGLEFFEKVVELVDKLKRPTQIVSHSLQTNGTLITKKWAEFFKNNNFLVGVSLDGPAKYHDVYRINKAAMGTHKLVERGWRILQEHGVELNLLCTVNAANQDYPLETYRYFRDELGARHIQFIPIVERVDASKLARAEIGWTTSELLYQQKGDAITSRSVSPEKYGHFLNTIFDEWYSHDIGTVFIQDIESALAGLFNSPTVCVHAPECGNNFAMEYNGDIYTCDHWVEPDYLIGNVNDNAAALSNQNITNFHTAAQSAIMRDFATKKTTLSARCRSCDVRSFCNGGCPKDRFIKNGPDTENYLCAGYHSFYTHIRPRLTYLARLVQAGM
ncbi:MAG: anaerobic sulfatase maturase [Corynebacterium sp.]|nr:anaerobic sulfatase maturase [Corynebacterium sp.]